MANKARRQKLVRVFKRAFEAEDQLNIEGALLVLELSPQLKWEDLKSGERFDKGVSNENADVALTILSKHVGEAVTESNQSKRSKEVYEFWNSWLEEDCADLREHAYWSKMLELIQVENNPKIDSGGNIADLGFTIYQMLMSFGEDGMSPEYDFILGRLTFVGPETFAKQLLPLLDIHKMNLKWQFFVDHCPNDPGEREIRLQLQKWFKDKPYADGRALMMDAIRQMDPIMMYLYNDSLLAFVRLDAALENGAAISRALKA